MWKLRFVRARVRNTRQSSSEAVLSWHFRIDLTGSWGRSGKSNLSINSPVVYSSLTVCSLYCLCCLYTRLSHLVMSNLDIFAHLLASMNDEHCQGLPRGTWAPRHTKVQRRILLLTVLLLVSWKLWCHADWDGWYHEEASHCCRAAACTMINTLGPWACDFHGGQFIWFKGPAGTGLGLARPYHIIIVRVIIAHSP